MERISIDRARRLNLTAQLLSGDAQLPPGKEGAAHVVEILGYVQIDSIHVVQRAHHHTLWTRFGDYAPDMLHELQAVDRRVFEYWGHAASYLPMADYRFFRPLMRAYENPRSKWVKNMAESCEDVMGPVLQRIREEGPLRASDFKPPDDAQRGTWWDWKPAKVALELLFWRGELMVRERQSFQRVYDLTERVLPADVDARMPTYDEAGRFFARRALRALAVATEREIHRHMRVIGLDVIAGALGDLVDSGEVVEVRVGDGGRSPDFALREILERPDPVDAGRSRLTLLSPFDNLINERVRPRRLFDFDYTLECYTSAAKRKHGYFVLPMLWRGSLVGRLDPKADRKTGQLLVRSLSFEPDVKLTDELVDAVADGLASLATFNACRAVVVEDAVPKKLKSTLARRANAALGH